MMSLVMNMAPIGKTIKNPSWAFIIFIDVTAFFEKYQHFFRSLTIYLWSKSIRLSEFGDWQLAGARAPATTCRLLLIPNLANFVFGH
jgi:hypothetical protein